MSLCVNEVELNFRFVCGSTCSHRRRKDLLPNRAISLPVKVASVQILVTGVPGAEINTAPVKVNVRSRFVWMTQRPDLLHLCGVLDGVNEFVLFRVVNFTPPSHRRRLAPARLFYLSLFCGWLFRSIRVIVGPASHHGLRSIPP